ncbi:MAG TPA: hypothetical protein VJB57_09190 [Dehalococcoidia bacterium]|nr:hypothetical protein [Dehalococcoidia bacterium]
MSDESFTEDFETAGVINVDRSAVRSLRATTAQVGQSAIQRLTAETVNAHNSAMGVVNASTVELRQGAAGVIAGDYVRVEDSRVFVLMAPRVSGNVRAVITLPIAFAFGAGYFLTRSLANAVFGRRNR